MDPDAFLRWVGPLLVYHRHARCRALADAHGYRLDARAVLAARSQDDVLELVAAAL